jgi:hypothetical protein
MLLFRTKECLNPLEICDTSVSPSIPTGDDWSSFPPIPKIPCSPHPNEKALPSPKRIIDY